MRTSILTRLRTLLRLSTRRRVLSSQVSSKRKQTSIQRLSVITRGKLGMGLLTMLVVISDTKPRALRGRTEGKERQGTMDTNSSLYERVAIDTIGGM